MITKATAKQWKRIEELKQRIIDSVTEQPDDERIRVCVRSMWKKMGKKPKAVLIADCPITGAIFWDLLSQLGSQLRSQLGSQLDSQLRSQLRSQLGSQLGSQLNSQLDSQLGSQLDSQLNSQLDSQLDSQLRSQLDSQLDSQLGSQLDSQLYISIWWKSWQGWYEGGKILGVKFDDVIFSEFKEWNDCIPVVYANDFFPIVSRFPSKVHWKNGLLHNESGKSVEFRSGWGIWTIDGVPVDEQIVMKPETQTIEQIDKEQNQDIRSIRIDRFGWPRYIKESGAKERSVRKNEVEGTLEALFKCKDGSQRFVVTCPTGRVFSLGVPSTVKTCLEAQNWLNGGRKLNVIAAT